MDFIEKLRNLSAKITNQMDVIKTEEGTRHAFVIPFIELLEYDITNPIEVVPEFTADVGTKQGEKVDYAIVKDEKSIILIECKKCGTDLSDAHITQLYRYFSVAHAQFAVLTNGVQYRFYTDSEAENKMDTKPFFEFNMLDIQPQWVNELKRFTKSAFDLDATITAAIDLKYTKEIKQIMMEQLEAPSEEFVRFFLSHVYSRMRTQAVVQQFTDIVKRALNQFLNEHINQRLQSAISREEVAEKSVEVEESDESIDEEVESGIVTTEEELEGFYAVKSIVREVVAPDRVVYRDTKSYMSVILDNNRLKPICRLYFNGPKKYLGLRDEEKNEERIEIESIDSIYNYVERLKVAAQRYDAAEPS